MLSQKDNELLTQVGANTPTGELLRRYWMPLLLSEELDAAVDAPVAVRALGEDFVAYRDGDGTARVIGARCPHRGTSLLYARNEGFGLRCLYHGWVMNGNGCVAEMPNDPDGTAKDKIRNRWCPTEEAGGIVWGYLGPPEDQPPPPAMGWTRAPECQRAVTKVRINCNYLQCLEGGLDTSHAGVLHATSLSKELYPDHPRNKTPMLELLRYDMAPSLEVEMTDTGLRYAALRDAGNGQSYARVTTWILPWFTSVPEHEGVPRFVNGFTPIDDTACWVWFIWYHPTEELNTPVLMEVSGVHNLLPGYSSRGNIDNQHMQDRAAMRDGISFSGIQGVSNEDTAMQEAQGPIADRTQERLLKSDQAIIRTRQALLQRVHDMQDGKLPGGRSEDIPYRFAQSAAWTFPEEEQWQDGYEKLLEAET
ncbi:MAG: Rieske 2Fe-2S domain-containing protein [Pseudomonadota bacterium]|nr:Rieske 2Fe-2S domain-containing protein [Pseudomonadota bacterium]